MNFIIDVLIVAIMLGFCISGFKNGFVKMVVRLFKNVIALIISSLFCSQAGLWIYEKFLKSFFENITVNKISEWLGVDKNTSLDIGPLIDAEHSEFFAFIEKLGFDIDTINEKYMEFGKNAGESMVEFISKPLGITVSTVIAFILLFIISVLAIKLLGFILGKMVKLPVLNATNKTLGLVLGAILGILFVFIFVAIVDTVAPYIKINGDLFTSSSLEEGTIIYKFLVGKTPGGLISEIFPK